MKDGRAFLAIALVVAATVQARAFEPDGCEQQRKQYPAKWNDTAAEKTLFTCESEQGRFYVKTGATDAAGRTLMSLVPFSRNNARVKVETGQDVLPSGSTTSRPAGCVTADISRASCARKTRAGSAAASMKTSSS
jgi:hypothetical protein